MLFCVVFGVGLFLFSLFSFDGEIVLEIYRKNVVCIEEFEKENKCFEKEVVDLEKRWQKVEEEFVDLWEVDGDVISGGDEQLVSFIIFCDWKYF